MTAQIAALPTPPSTNDPANFDTRADTLLGQLPAFVTQANALSTEVNGLAVQTAADRVQTAADVTTVTGLKTDVNALKGQAQTSATNAANAQTAAAASAAAAAASATTAAGFTATSTTSLTVGLGARSLTLAESGRAFVVGDFVVIASTAAPANFMTGQVTAFASGTGAMTVNVTGIGGSGSAAGWTVGLSGQPGAAVTSGTLTGVLNYAPSVTLASAATTDIGSVASNNVTITGAATIAALGTAPEGATRNLTFAGAATLTHNATSLILPGAATVTVAAGDTCVARSLGSGNWRLTGDRLAMATTSDALAGAATGKIMSPATTKAMILSMNPTPIGTRSQFEINPAPPWLPLAGGAVSISAYPTLYGLYGHTNTRRQALSTISGPYLSGYTLIDEQRIAGAWWGLYRVENSSQEYIEDSDTWWYYRSGGFAVTRRSTYSGTAATVWTRSFSLSSLSGYPAAPAWFTSLSGLTLCGGKIRFFTDTMSAWVNPDGSSPGQADGTYNMYPYSTGSSYLKLTAYDGVGTAAVWSNAAQAVRYTADGANFASVANPTDSAFRVSDVRRFLWDGSSWVLFCCDDTQSNGQRIRIYKRPSLSSGSWISYTPNTTVSAQYVVANGWKGCFEYNPFNNMYYINFSGATYTAQASNPTLWNYMGSFYVSSICFVSINFIAYTYSGYLYFSDGDLGDAVNKGMLAYGYASDLRCFSDGFQLPRSPGSGAAGSFLPTPIDYTAYFVLPTVSSTPQIHVYGG